MSDEVFMVGNALLVCPVVTKQQKYVDLLELPGRWYNLLTLKETKTDEFILVKLEEVYSFVRGGKTIMLFDNKDVYY